MFNQQKVIVGSLILFLLAGLLGVVFFQRNLRMQKQQDVFCTMDAKICPDGSAVGRIGPDCEFTPCPATNVSVTPSVTALPSQIESTDCLNNLGEPQDPAACSQIPPGARSCKIDADCQATCSKGCLGRSWLSQNQMIDCTAEPIYDCSCQANLCQKRLSE